MPSVPKAVATPPLVKAEALLGPKFEGHHELWDGHVLVREACGFDSDAVSARVASILLVHADRQALGRVTGSSAGFVLARDPDRLLVPDAAFVSKARARIVTPGRFAEGPPDLAVEVRSPSDSWISVVRKAGLWLAHGTRVVWAIDPEARRVVVFRGLDEPVTLGPRDMLDGAPVLPRLRFRVDRLFRGW
jgi:Uma2 family endonuclease